MKLKESLPRFKSSRWLLLAVAVFAGSLASASAHEVFINSVLISGLSGLKGLSIAAAPEPTTFALMGIGGLSVVLFRRLRK